MSEFLTAYPRRISVMKGLHDFIRNEEIQFDHLSLMVKIKKDEIIKTLISEGFRRVKLENKKPSPGGATSNSTSMMSPLRGLASCMCLA